MKGLVPSVLTLPEMGKVKAPFSMVTIGERLMTCTLWSNTCLEKNVHPVQFLDTVKVLLKIATTGGDDVLLYASTYHDIRTVVNVSGRYDLKKGIEERLGKDYMEVIKKEGFIDVKNKSGAVSYRVTEDSLMDRLSTDMHESCLQIDKECRVLTIHGTADEIIPVEDALEFAKIIPNHKLHLIEGANHSYTSHQAELASVVLDFIKAALQQDKATSN
ncbi:unnamed protein product [Malus baccata var. baccata]